MLIASIDMNTIFVYIFINNNNIFEYHRRWLNMELEYIYIVNDPDDGIKRNIIVELNSPEILLDVSQRGSSCVYSGGFWSHAHQFASYYHSHKWSWLL